MANWRVYGCSNPIPAPRSATREAQTAEGLQKVQLLHRVAGALEVLAIGPSWDHQNSGKSIGGHIEIWGLIV